MQQQQQQPQCDGFTPIQDAKRAANLLVFATQAIASPVEVCIRSKFGPRYFGLAALAGFVVMPMWPLWWPGEDASGIEAFWLWYLLMLVINRTRSLRMASKGEPVHSRYNGWPGLARFFPRTSEAKIKAWIEPLCVFLAGLIVRATDVPLGSYLIVAAIALFFTNGVIAAVERARITELNDALIDQQIVAERFRRLRGDRTR